MAKTRLADWRRAKLRNLARDIVSAPDEKATLDKASAAAAPLVRAMVHKIYPPRDMRVCKKYDAAWVDDCIKMQLTAGGIEQFHFPEGKGPLVAQKTYSRKPYAADEEVSKVVSAWVLARDAHTKAVKTKLADYNALITALRTFEDVAEIWPEAEQLRPDLCGPGTALVALDKQAVARIKADVASRQQA